MRRILIGLIAATMIALAGCSTGGLRGTDNPDQALEGQILHRLRSESPQFAPSVAISVSDGVVSVFGTKDNKVMRARVGAVIETTPGVTQVIMVD